MTKNIIAGICFSALWVVPIYTPFINKLFSPTFTPEVVSTHCKPIMQNLIFIMIMLACFMLTKHTKCLKEAQSRKWAIPFFKQPFCCRCGGGGWPGLFRYPINWMFSSFNKDTSLSRRYWYKVLSLKLMISMVIMGFQNYVLALFHKELLNLLKIYFCNCA
jgi:hypothetical protein